jgi:glycosyltransferase involved in cell wall biosynthesis
VDIWFFVGDSLDWLDSHESVSGVTRVTIEVFYGALEHQDEFISSVIPCVLTDSNLELMSVSLNETIEYLAVKTGRSVPISVPAARPATRPVPSHGPKFGDYVLFTGVVWTPLYTEVFRQLNTNGVNLCVLVHDIIPIERPDLVSDDSQRMFTEWLQGVIATAKILFVSSRVTQDHILRWAAMSGNEVRARIVPIIFGSPTLDPAPSRQVRGTLNTERVKLSSFVLSVGTIDRRKNQSLLFRIWNRLISELGESRVPQLVLAGRNDLNFADCRDTKLALERSQIIILEGVSDPELSGLYRACQFTVFPSLSEGYGLPVAESLGYGKLCIASDLATIKEHAGDLAWYFDPDVESTAFDCIRLAIERPDLRLQAEQRIIRHYSPTRWESTFKLIGEAIRVSEAG